ncbi:MAG: hypothetical protein ABI649_09205 [Gaiellaceae bacterium]
MSLRGEPVEEHATLPDGRVVRIWLGIPDDSYVKRRDIDTVAIELWSGTDLVGSVKSLLTVHETSEARAIARQIKAGLEAGELEPTAGAIEPFAESIPEI